MMITLSLPGMDVSGYVMRGQVCWCPSLGAMKTGLIIAQGVCGLSSHYAVCGRSALCQTGNSIKFCLTYSSTSEKSWVD